jgi:osmotically-inducible protein OsmY
MVSVLSSESNGRSLLCPIAHAAKERLRRVPYSGVQDVSCECDGQGLLVLRGRLPSFFHKQVAQEAVRNLAGVTQVVNQIEVS